MPLSRHVVFVSGPTPASLRRAAAWLLEREWDFDGALRLRVGEGPRRAVAVGSSEAGLRGALRALSLGEAHPGVVTGLVGEAPPRVGFLLTGEGSERAAAGQVLLGADAAFAEAVRSGMAAVDRPALASLDADLRQWRDLHLGKLLLGALDLGLAAALRARGVQPSAVCGHSVGEYVAAALAGGVSTSDAMRLLDDLGRRLKQSEVLGGLALARGSSAEVQALLAETPEVGLAVDNAADWVALWGSPEGLARGRERLRAAGVSSRGIPVSRPMHGPLVAGIAEQVVASARQLEHAPPSLPWVSTVEAAPLAALDATYWGEAMTRPVRFREAWAVARALPVDLWVELGPKPGLSLFVEEGAPVLAALDPKLDDRAAFARLLGWLWCHGQPLEEAEGAAELSWAAEAAPTEAPRATLPLPQALSLVLEETAALLGRPLEPADAERGLFELGVDSAGLLSLAEALGERCGVTLTMQELFRAGSLASVAQRLAGEGRARAPRGPRPVDNQVSIALTGVGLRMPGGVVDLDTLWALLAEGRDAVGAVPPGRWPEALPPELPRFGGFLDEVAAFEPGFFGISPREALHLDPTQRLLLECAWEALEDAGLDPTTLEGSATGVFLGVGPSGYGAAPMLQRLDAMQAQAGTGNETSVAAGRVAHVLGLRGPAMSVDTACSSSLTAITLAARALQRGECSMALAGGGSLLLSPATSAWLAQAGALSPSGRSRAFSADADGFGRGEGVVVFTLKRLHDAQADGDRILGVLRGAALNHDGASAGLTVPNPEAQIEVIQAALADAGLAPEDVDLLECHGTGTRLGDPVEVDAIGQVFAGRSAPLRLGSVKSNLGHLEWAAGAAGVA
ncbi:MAG: acyltransferase domain-containing protein, partial [Alphaproteobacteria bacterium]|nr:acyltransferase domain-containing protein [Alphaproteobacteria bacterium]